MSRGAGGSAHPKLDPSDLLVVAKKAAQLGTEIVLDAADKPRKISRKEGTDVVTETDKASEAAILGAIRAAFPDHALLGEEGGVTGNTASDYLWVVDPLDGTANFSTGYSHFCVCVGVMRHATPVAGCVVEFQGGHNDWHARTFWATRNGGSFVDGRSLVVSPTKALKDAMIATELVYYDEELWTQQALALREFTREARGVRMSGAAAANLLHLAEGRIDAYYQWHLKPWDTAAAALIAEEAGARLSTTDGTAWSAFDRSFLATNDALYEKVLPVLEPKHRAAVQAGAEIGRQWHVPKGYRVRSGAQLEN